MMIRRPVSDTGDVATELTRMQLRMWMGQQFNLAAPAYNMAFTFALEGAVDPARFQRAFQALLDRCDALRTCIVNSGEGPRQYVANPYPYTLEVVDLDGEEALAPWLEARTRVPRRLDERLFDTALVRLPGNRFVWYLAVHHIVMDGWSYALLFRHLGAYYAWAEVGTLDTAPPLPSFQAYVRATHDRSNGTHPKTATSPPLVFYGKAPDHRSERERRIRVVLGPERTARLEALARADGFRSLNHHLSLTNILLGVLFIYLHRATGNRTLVVGMPFHNRFGEASRDVIGLLQETVPVRVVLASGDTFASVNDKVMRALWKAMRQARKGGTREEDLRAYEVMLNYPNVVFGDFAGRPATPAWVHPGYGDGNRLLFIQAHDFNGEGRLTLDFDANEGVFDEATHRRAVAQYLHLLDLCLAHPEQVLDEADLLPAAEKKRLLVDFNDTKAAYPEAMTLADLFEAQAARTPDDVAVVFGETRLTYAALNALANRMAHALRRRGVGPGVPVAVCAARSVEGIAGLLAIFKAGGGYLPLDPSYPRERLAFMRADAGAPVLLTQERLRHTLPAADVDVCCLDTLDLASEPATNPPRPDTTAADLAYLIYTSGSTGKPKGVAMPQQAMTNLIWWQMHTATRLKRPRTLQFTPLSFDVSLQETFATWCSGGTLVLCPESVRRDPEATLRVLIEEEIEQLYIIFSPLQHLAEAAVRMGRYPTRLREVITAGEQVRITPAVATFFEHLPDCTFQNQYGPSETHIVTKYLLEGPPSTWPALPSIGRPLANTEAYILDPQRRPVPLGATGELYIGGVQVATGYVNRPALTAERFVPDPFSGRPGARLYKTGDLARFFPDGNIEFLGRIDHQVKVRGFRIELGEIEAVLGRHPAVRETTVVAREDVPGDKRLVAYLVPATAEPPTTEALRRFLMQELPEYMVPAVFVPLEALPQTPNGKVDRKALPAPTGRLLASETAYVPPQTGVEQVVAEVWKKVLRVDRVGKDDNFFTLGGDSLLLVQVHGALRDRLGRDLSVVDLFRYPSVHTLAAFLQEEGTGQHGVDAARERAKRQQEALRQQKAAARRPLRGRP